MRLTGLCKESSFSKAITGVKESTPTWKTCVTGVGFNNAAGSFSLGLVAGSMYVRRFFDPEAKASMLEMTKYIRYPELEPERETSQNILMRTCRSNIVKCQHSQKK